MFNRSWNLHRWLRAALCAGMLAGAARPAAAAVNVALTPATIFVAPGTEFDVNLDVTSAGSPFNGFSAILSFNPAVLTLVPLLPSSLGEGCLMTGVCSAACGSTLHQFEAAADSAVMNDYLFCNAVALTGPGHLYRVRFRAANTPQLTSLTIRRATFYNAGLLVTPVVTAGNTVNITLALGVGQGPAAPRPLRVEPNPAFGRTNLVVVDANGGLTETDVLDAQGRLVRHLGFRWLGPNAVVEWDGMNDRGSRAPGGIYLARVRRGGRVETTRFVLLR